MPQPTYHMLVARQQLQRWANHGVQPFNVYDQRNQAAFMQGAIGPDIGYFPGCARLISEFAHDDRSGDVVRALLQRASDELAIAYAFGWASHLLLDALIHPLVNRVAADRIGCSPRDSERIHMLHVRLEIGLDLSAHAEDPELQKLRHRPVFDRPGTRFIRDALADVYEVELLPALVAEAHWRAAQFLGPMTALQTALLVTRLAGVRWSPIITGARWGVRTLETVARTLKGEHSECVAFLRPLDPDAHFLEECTQLRTRFHQIFEAHCCTVFADFPNYDVANGGFAPPAAKFKAIQRVSA